ncbi:hypothetical protein [Streptomyces canus]|uniref:hypothetical protein n=1 Tax=Streptomyces canus TaxID=58343 RepID=UPI002E2BCB7F|nr:hypothetical protein [Streptomyces canus]
MLLGEAEFALAQQHHPGAARVAAVFGEAGMPLYKASARAVAATAVATLGDQGTGPAEEARAQALFQSDL